MNEFIEKLIGRLKKYQIEYKSGFGELTDETVFRVMENVIYTINQLAEEYNNESVKGDLISRSLLLDCLSYYISHTDEKSGEHYAYERAKDLIEKQPKYYNDGWIPCSEDKPKKNGWYECWYMTSSVGENKYYEPITLYWEDNIWLYRPNKFTMPAQSNVVAWKPIAHYQPKGE